MSNLGSIFNSMLSKEKFKNIGVTLDFFSIPPSKRDNKTSRIEITTGNRSADGFIDIYTICIGNPVLLAKFDYFRRSIELFKPFESFLAEFKNENDINAYGRQWDIPNKDKPAIIRGFHYLDGEMANSIGGIDYCLNAPAWKIEKFCEGILIQLTEDVFTSDNPEHLEIQENVMKYFKMM